MEVEQVLHMNGGLGDTSYANNSLMQRKALSMVKLIMEEAIRAFYTTTCPQKLAIADLGCSSGPNTLFIVSEFIKMVDNLCKRRGLKNPEYQVFLNDLPGNDFNTIFKSLPNFMKELRRQMDNQKSEIYFTGVPGSFYTRLFPSKSLHFIHSSYSLHWLSQVPRGLEINKGNVYIASTSPPDVFKAYYEQFQNDFSTFLRYRAEELLPGGHMILTVMGRKSEDPSSKECTTGFNHLAMALNQMVSEGLITEEKLNSFNIPMYMPSAKEVEFEVQKEGSFSIDCLKTIGVGAFDSCDASNDIGNIATKALRAVSESLLINHFGVEVIEDIFRRFRVLITDWLSKEKDEVINVTISLIKKA